MDTFLNTDLSAKKGTDYFKIKEGANKLRILSSPVACYQAYQNGGGYKYSWDYIENGSKRYNCYVIDLEDNKLKWWAMPKSCALQVQALAKDPDTPFTSFPMPYDVKITAQGAGSKEVVYMVLPGKESPISEEILTELAGKTRIQEILENRIMKQSSAELEITTDYDDTEAGIPF